jgi:hypothetical protein
MAAWRKKLTIEPITLITWEIDLLLAERASEKDSTRTSRNTEMNTR